MASGPCTSGLDFRCWVVEDEERWQTLGRVGSVVLLVAHTYQAMAENELIRIISARKAKPRERRIYESRHDETAD